MSEDQNRSEEASEQAEEIKSEAEEKVAELKDEVEEKAAEVKADAEEKLDEVKAETEEKLDALKADVEEMTEDLEERLQEAGIDSDEVKEQISEAAEEAKEKVAEAAEEAKEKVAEVAAQAEENLQEITEAPNAGHQLNKGAWIGITCAALAVGMLIGAFVVGRLSSSFAGSEIAGHTVITEKQLDTPLATMTYDGVMENISARDIFEENGSVEAAKNEDGTYAVPAADQILNSARNTILAHEAENAGITASDDDVKAYAEEHIGSSDFAAIGEQYQMDEATVVSVLRNSVIFEKLRNQVVGELSDTMPDAPAQPAEGADASQPTKEYADYVIALAGDEWDAENATWKATDGPYATALANYEVKPDGATYEAAQAAYYVAYQNYSQKTTELNKKWSDYMNGLFSNARIEISTLVTATQG